MRSALFWKMERIGCPETLLGNYNSTVPRSFLLYCLTLECGNDRIVRKIGKELPLDAA